MELFSIFGRILLKDNGVENKLNSVTKKAEETSLTISKLGEKTQSFGESLSKVGKSLFTHLTLPIGVAAGAVVKFADKSSDLYEAQNVVENTFKKSAKSIEAWTNTTAKSAGISKTASSQWVGFMGAMLKSSGVSEKAAANMSKNLVQLTGDMSSFYNISTSDMWEKIRSGISGETEPLKQLGINMSVVNLETYAMSQGIKKSYKDMSQAEQTTLRYNYLLSVTKDAQGDFGRTLNNSFANQARVAKLNLETLVSTFGSKFLPVIMDGTKKLNEFGTALNNALNGKNESAVLGKTINNIANAISKLTSKQIKGIIGIGAALATLGPGIKIMGKLTEGAGKFEKGISKAAKTVTNFSGRSISSFKNLGKSASSIFSKFGNLTIFKKLGSAFDTLRIKGLYAFDALKNGAVSKFNIIGKTASKVFGKLPSAITDPLGKISGLISAEGPGIIAAFSDLGNKTIGGLKHVMDLAFKFIGPTALVGILLTGLGVAQEKFGEQIDKFAQTAITKGPEIITQFVNGITAKLPELINEGAILVQTLLEAIITNAPAIIKGAVQIITTLVNGIADNLPRLIPVVIQLIQTIVIAIVDNLPTIVQAGLNILVALIQGIANNMDKIVNTIVKVIEEIIKVIIQNLPSIIQAGIQIIVALIQGLAQATPQLIAAIPSIVKAIWNGLKSADWAGLGKSIIQGIGEGLKAAAGGLLNTVKAIGSDILKGFKAMFGIHSPSTVFRDEVGKNISLGIAEGIKDVDFMQTISDILNYGTDDAKTSAKKVTNAVSTEISKIKDNTTKVVKDLNTQLNNLSEQEAKALRGVKGSKRYTIQDEYNEKKKVIRDEIQLRKEQADKEIEQIKRIGKMSKEELQQELQNRKSFVDSVNSLNEQIKNALKSKYTEEEKKAEDSINNQIHYWEDWRTKSEDAINSVFDEKKKRLEEDQKATEEALQAESDALDNWKDESIRNIEGVSNAKIAALKAQEDALDEQAMAEDMADKHKEYEDKISDLQSQIKYSHDDYNKAELEKQLKSVQSEYQKELHKEEIDDKKAALRTQEEAIKADADKQKQNVEDIYSIRKADLNKRLQDNKKYYDKQKALMEQDKKAQIDNINQIYNANKNTLDKQLTDVQVFYSKKLSDANLEAEAEKMIMQKSQDEIVALLNSYGEQYKAAGQTLGERLVEGFEPAISSIKSMISSITAEISSARDSAISTMQLANTAVGANSIPNTNTSKTVSNNSNTAVTNNFNFTHNSPTKVTPSEEKRQDESFFRKAAYQLA